MPNVERPLLSSPPPPLTPFRRCLLRRCSVLIVVNLNIVGRWGGGGAYNDETTAVEASSLPLQLRRPLMLSSPLPLLLLLLQLLLLLLLLLRVHSRLS